MHTENEIMDGEKDAELIKSLISLGIPLLVRKKLGTSLWYLILRNPPLGNPHPFTQAEYMVD